MFFRIKTLVQKELRTLLRDPQSARLLIGVVVLQLVLFPFAATMEVKNNTLAIFNQDSGARSAELIQRISQAEAFSEVIYVDSQTEIEALIDGQQALLAIRFPADFSRNLVTGSPSTPAGPAGWTSFEQQPDRICLCTADGDRLPGGAGHVRPGPLIHPGWKSGIGTIQISTTSGLLCPP